MADATLIIEPNKPESGKQKNKGDYEAFLDMTPPVNESKSVKIIVPSGWTVIDMNIYTLDVSGGEVQRSEQKKADIKELKNGDLADFTSVFTTNHRSVVGITGSSESNVYTLTVANTLGNTSDVGWFEYLLWITDSANSNDFVDPGLRNGGSE